MEDPTIAATVPRPTLRDGSLRGAVVAVLVAISVVVVACGGEASEDEGGSTATGVIVDVRGTISEVDEFELALSDGSRIVFRPEAGALERSGFSPAHLREHMALAEPISVRYVEESEGNVMTSIGDAGD